MTFIIDHLKKYKSFNPVELNFILKKDYTKKELIVKLLAMDSYLLEKDSQMILKSRGLR